MKNFTKWLKRILSQINCYYWSLKYSQFVARFNDYTLYLGSKLVANQLLVEVCYDFDATNLK